MVASAYQVRYKKCDGIIEFTNIGIKWKCDPSSSKSSSVKDGLLENWASIKEQQVSSHTSSKAMIRLKALKHSYVFEFLNPILTKAFELRDNAKSIIMLKMQVRTGPVPSCPPLQLKHRAAVLASQPALKKQHREMVDSGLISEEDFWSGRQNILTEEASKRQRTAKTTHLLTDLAAQSEPGEKVVKYNLNAEMIHQIFVQYPAVYRAYKAQVPDRMSETEFWSIFLKSNFFHRDRGKTGHEDLFTKYEEEQKNVEASIQGHVDPRGKVDPLVDLTSTSEGEVIHPTLRLPTSVVDNSLRKFNRHAAFVLDSSQPGKYTTLDSKELTPLRGSSKRSINERLSEAIRLPDLEGEKPHDYIALELEDEKRYFDRSSSATGSSAMPMSPEKKDHLAALGKARMQNAFPTSQRAMEVIVMVNELTKPHEKQHVGAVANVVDIPENFKMKIFENFLSVQELLRHFWAFCQTCKNENEYSKVQRIVSKMEEKYESLLQLKKNMQPDERSTLAPLLKPFDDQLNHAFVHWGAQKKDRVHKKQRVA